MRLIAVLLLWPVLALAESVVLPFIAPTERTDGTPIDPAELTLFQFRCVDFTPPTGISQPCDSTVVAVGGSSRQATVILTVPNSGGYACFDGRAFMGDQVIDWGDDVCTTFPAAAVSTVSKLVYEKQGRRFPVVGSVALGVPCGAKVTSYYALPRNAVTVTSRKYRGGTPLGVCK